MWKMWILILFGEIVCTFKIYKIVFSSYPNFLEYKFII
jgi:hypothetical protein